MSTVLRFSASGIRYVVDVAMVVEVRDARELAPLLVGLPDPQPGVLGLLPDRDGGGAVSVLTLLGPGRLHVLVLRAAPRVFGLMVDEVHGLSRLTGHDAGPAPAGQRSEVLIGTVAVPDAAGDTVTHLLLDPARLADALAGDLDLTRLAADLAEAAP